MKDRTKLSERQRNILRFIENHLENHGFPPTIRQIGKATGIESTSVVNYNLNKLVSAGYLSREARASRGLRLVKANGGKRGVSANAQTMIVPMYGQIVAGQPVPIPKIWDTRRSITLTCCHQCWATPIRRTCMHCASKAIR
jgi:repressor LexA